MMVAIAAHQPVKVAGTSVAITRLSVSTPRHVKSPASASLFLHRVPGHSIPAGAKPMKSYATIPTRPGARTTQSSVVSPTKNTANGIQSSATTSMTASNIQSSVNQTIRIASQNGPATTSVIPTITPQSVAGTVATAASQRLVSIQVAKATSAWPPTHVRTAKPSAQAGTASSAITVQNTALAT